MTTPPTDDLRARLQQTVRDLGEHRQTHVVWRDWLQKDPSNDSVNPHAGSAEFHAGVILDYDRHLANINEALAALSALPAGERWEADGIKEALLLGRLKGHEVFYTTPPPDAAVGDYESWAKQERQREDAKARLGAAVGAQGGEVVIGAARCYGEDKWFRELTVQGVTFLAPLDQQDKARHVLAAPADVGAQGDDVAAWSNELVRLLHGYGFSTEAATVFASAEIAEYRAGQCDCAELAPIDMVDLLMDTARSAVEAWKLESAGRPFGYKLAAPAAGKGVDDAMVERASLLYLQAREKGASQLAAIRSALAALTRQPVAGDGWRPIESAPRDGTRVLLRLKHGLPAHVHGFEGVVFVGKWLGGHSHWAFAAPVGQAGFPDEWMDGWCRAAPADTPADGGEGK